MGRRICARVGFLLSNLVTRNMSWFLARTMSCIIQALLQLTANQAVMSIDCSTSICTIRDNDIVS